MCNFDDICIYAYLVVIRLVLYQVLVIIAMQFMKFMWLGIGDNMGNG